MTKQQKDIGAGLIFSIFWTSATVTTKIGIRFAEPILFSCIRFLLVGIILMLYTYVFRRTASPLPSGSQWKSLLIMGFFNITLYIGAFVIAVKSVSAGLISLISATNPLVLTLVAAIWRKRTIRLNEWIGIGLATVGLVLAALPTLKNGHASWYGLIILFSGIISVSVGSVYYSRQNWNLPGIVVNTWQTSFGGLFFVPLVLLWHKHLYLKPAFEFYATMTWMIIPVSIIAYGLWLFLLMDDPVRAGLWLFLTPVLGYAMAAVFLHETVSPYALSGTLLVLGGLWRART